MREGEVPRGRGGPARRPEAAREHAPADAWPPRRRHAEGRREGGDEHLGRGLGRRLQEGLRLVARDERRLGGARRRHQSRGGLPQPPPAGGGREGLRHLDQLGRQDPAERTPRRPLHEEDRLPARKEGRRDAVPRRLPRRAARQREERRDRARARRGEESFS